MNPRGHTNLDHCRLCGDVICENCSKKRVLIKTKNSLERTCDKCYKTALASYGSQRDSAGAKSKRNSVSAKGESAIRRPSGFAIDTEEKLKRAQEPHPLAFLKGKTVCESHGVVDLVFLFL